MENAPTDFKPVKQPAKRAANKRKRPSVESEAEAEENCVEQSPEEQQEGSKASKTKTATKAPPYKRGRGSQGKDDGASNDKSPPGDKSGEQSVGSKGKRPSKPPIPYWVVNGNGPEKPTGTRQPEIPLDAFSDSSNAVIESKKVPAKPAKSKGEKRMISLTENGMITYQTVLRKAVSPAKTTIEEDLSDDQPLAKPQKKPRGKGKSHEAVPVAAEGDDLTG